jgi:hypothetical protein
VEDAFAKLVGRQASERERERLYRVRDALGLRDNDALWSIVIALEHYDSFFRQYPEKLAEETGRCIESARAAFAVAAENEAAQVQRVLSEKVAETSVQIAHKLAERPVGLHRVTMVLAAVVAFGAPFWLTKDYLPSLDTSRRFGLIMATINEEFPSIREHSVCLPRDFADGLFTAYWGQPEMYLDAEVRRNISNFALARDEDVKAGLDALRSDLESGAWDRSYGYLRMLTELDLGHRVLVAELP